MAVEQEAIEEVVVTGTFQRSGGGFAFTAISYDLS